MVVGQPVEALAGAAQSPGDPSDLLGLVEGLYAVDMLIVAVGWFQLFDVVAARPVHVRELVDEHGMAERSADVLVTLCQAYGLLTVDEHGILSNTELARDFLTCSSPWSLVPCYAGLRARPSCRDLLAVLRPEPASDGAGKAESLDWLTRMGELEFAETFLRSTDSRSSYLADLFAARLPIEPNDRLLDVAGGSGLFTRALARRHPGLTATILEKPPVDELAARAVAAQGLADRVAVHSADMFDDPLPTGHQAHLFSNVLHDWGPVRNAELLAASYRALPHGGTVHVHEAFLNERKSGPRSVAAYSVLLLLFTEGRCYSSIEIGQQLTAAGFIDLDFVPTTAGRGILSARKPSVPRL